MLLNVISEFLDALIVLRSVEEDEERKTLLRKLLGILEGDLANQRSTFVSRPNANLVKTKEIEIG